MSMITGHAYGDDDVIRRRLVDDDHEFHSRYLLQYDHRLHTALSVRVFHHDVAVAVV